MCWWRRWRGVVVVGVGMVRGRSGTGRAKRIMRWRGGEDGVEGEKEDIVSVGGCV